MDGYFRDKLIKRLAKKRIIDNKGCWIWTGNIGNHGYGTTHFNGSIRLIHRLSAALFLDFEIDSEKRIEHSCDNKKCFNPDHLKIKD